jgi:hypothetical protein
MTLLLYAVYAPALAARDDVVTEVPVAVAADRPDGRPKVSCPAVRLDPEFERRRIAHLDYADYEVIFGLRSVTIRRTSLLRLPAP